MARVLKCCFALLGYGVLAAAPAAADIASTAVTVPGARGASMVAVAAEPLGSVLVAWYAPAAGAVRVADRRGSRWRTARIPLVTPPAGLSAWYGADGPGVAYADSEGIWIAQRATGWRPALLVAGDAAAVDAVLLADGGLYVVAGLREAGGARLLAFTGALSKNPSQRDLGVATAATPLVAERFGAGAAVAYAGARRSLVVLTDDGARRRVHRLDTRAGDIQLAADANGSVAAVYSGLMGAAGARFAIGVAHFGTHGGARRAIERQLPCRDRPRPVAIGYVANELRVGYLVCTGSWRLAHGDGQPATVSPAGRLVGELRASATIAGRMVLVGAREGGLELQWLRP
jgi:hypothetical protein